MLQIFLNYLAIIIIPALIGVIARLAFMKRQKGYIVSVIFGCISVVAILYALLIYSHGDEGPALLAFSSLIATVTSLVCGGIINIVKNRK